MGWIGCAIWQKTSKRHPGFFPNFQDMFFKDFFKNPQTTIALTFLAHIISCIDGVLVYLDVPSRDQKHLWLVSYNIMKQNRCNFCVSQHVKSFPGALACSITVYLTRELSESKTHSVS